MGKHKRRQHKTKQNDQKKGVRGSWKLDTIEKINDHFEAFYKAQSIVHESEWDSFMESLRRELPHAFRFLGFLSEAEALRNIMQDRYLNHLTSTVVDGEPIEPPKVLPWYPRGLGYQMKIPRQVIRKEILLNKLHNFLVTETELGNVSRQETVSMVPPLLLDVRAEHKILDMCAAPGSKTAQLIESLLADENQPMPSGFVVANDADNKRCYMLVHQSLKRLQNACCIVINHDAANLPNIYVSADDGKTRGITFDRILCDVPCSGDGTLRKNVDIWKNWSASKAYNLHRLQFRILKRGFDLLAPGGRLVYSTCSLNPTENEAVVARILQETGGCFELVDVSDQLPGLKRSSGLKHWKVMDTNGRFYCSFDEAKNGRNSLFPSLFPPPAETVDNLHLERCIRILPHQQDTGGFFVAVLEKKEDCVLAREETDVEDGKSQVPVVTEPKLKKPRFSGYKEDPFIFFHDDDPRWEDIKENFGVVSEFPVSQVLSRSAESFQKRNLYLVNAGIKDIIVNNRDDIKIVNAGLRIFGRVEQKYKRCKYRLAQDGLRVMLPFLSKRILELSRADMVLVLTSARNCRISTLSDGTQKELENICEGGVAFYCLLKNHKVQFCSWRGKVSVAPYISKDSKIHILRLLGQDTSALEEEVQSKRKKAGRAGGGEPQTNAASTPEQDNSAQQERDNKIKELTDAVEDHMM